MSNWPYPVFGLQLRRQCCSDLLLLQSFKCTSAPAPLDGAVKNQIQQLIVKRVKTQHLGTRGVSVTFGAPPSDFKCGGLELGDPRLQDTEVASHKRMPSNHPHNPKATQRCRSSLFQIIPDCKLKAFQAASLRYPDFERLSPANHRGCDKLLRRPRGIADPHHHSASGASQVNQSRELGQMEVSQNGGYPISAWLCG